MNTNIRVSAVRTAAVLCCNCLAYGHLDTIGRTSLIQFPLLKYEFVCNVRIEINLQDRNSKLTTEKNIESTPVPVGLGIHDHLLVPEKHGKRLIYQHYSQCDLF